MYKVNLNGRTFGICNECFQPPHFPTMKKFFDEDEPAFTWGIVSRWISTCDACGKQADKYYGEIQYAEGRTPSTFGCLYAESDAEALELLLKNKKPEYPIRVIKGKKWHEKDRLATVIEKIGRYSASLYTEDWKFGDAGLKLKKED